MSKEADRKAYSYCTIRIHYSMVAEAARKHEDRERTVKWRMDRNIYHEGVGWRNGCPAEISASLIVYHLQLYVPGSNK